MSQLTIRPLRDSEIVARAGTLLKSIGMYSAKEVQFSDAQNCFVKIQSDGSTRRFWRASQKDRSLCIVAAPAGNSDAELAESRATWLIGNHLKNKGVPVPELFGWDRDNGILLFEDLGDLRLHDLAGKPRPSQQKNTRSLADYYREVLTCLAVMQIKGAEGFIEEWCWDTPRYDTALMQERESGYFLRAFWLGVLGEEIPPGVTEEFREIAVQAGKAPADFFLHRDFQSRNIMLSEDRVRFIDFQGGRLGPLGYDVASLLIDPYAGLSLEQQEEFLEFYLKVLVPHQVLGVENFSKHYTLLALQRNLQIIGAFSFLYRVKGKVFFADFIRPAVVTLRERLAESFFSGFPQIRALADTGLARLSLP